MNNELEMRAWSLLADQYEAKGYCLTADDMRDPSKKWSSPVLCAHRAIVAALSQQPSAVDSEQSIKAYVYDTIATVVEASGARPNSISEYITSMIESQQPSAVHPDDAAVDTFATAMKAKLAEARSKGRGGWDDKDDCTQQRLSDMLRNHVVKGDPRDVANFAMFLHQRGESIAPSQQVEGVPDGAGVTIRADGDANSYTITQANGNWLASVLLNGEMNLHSQVEAMEAMSGTGAKWVGET